MLHGSMAGKKNRAEGAIYSARKFSNSRSGDATYLGDFLYEGGVAVTAICFL
ncbi:uncharacterized protein METZ01_LOCUS150863 [marine metagenome]|uniref:Uncharacterized protein n=1 Tax=marine metagenome TaxID=408172 RepID=A0A382A9E4_9ZZZZ